MRSLLKRRTELRVLPTLRAFRTRTAPRASHSLPPLPSTGSCHPFLLSPLCKERRSTLCRQLSSTTRQDAPCVLSPPTLRLTVGTKGKTDNQEQSANSYSGSERIFDEDVSSLLITVYTGSGILPPRYSCADHMMGWPVTLLSLLLPSLTFQKFSLPTDVLYQSSKRNQFHQTFCLKWQCCCCLLLVYFLFVPFIQSSEKLDIVTVWLKPPCSRALPSCLHII